MKLAETIKAKVLEAIEEFRKATSTATPAAPAAEAGEITAEIKAFIQEQLAAANTELTALRAEVTTAKATITTLTATVAERDAKIKELNAVIADPKGKIETTASLKAQEIAAGQGAKALVVNLSDNPRGAGAAQGNATERCLARKQAESASRN